MYKDNKSLYNLKIDAFITKFFKNLKPYHKQ